MNLYASSALINCISSSTIGLFVFIRKRRDPKWVSYVLFCFSVFVWSYFYFIWQISKNEFSALFNCRGLMAGAIFIPIFYFHHILTLLDILKEKKKILILGYVFAFISFALNFTPLFIKSVSLKLNYGLWPNPGVAFNLFLPIWFGFVLYGVYLLILEFKISTGFKRNQIKYVLLATFIGWSGGATSFPLWYNIPIPPVANVLVSVYVVIVAYTILAYKLLDIELAIARSFILFCVYSFVLLVVAWLWYPMRPYLQALLGENWYLLPLGVFAALSMAAPFAYLYYQQKYDQRRLQRQRAQLAKLKQITATSMDIDHEQLLKNIPPFLMQMYREDFQTEIDGIAIYFCEKNQNSYKLISYKTKRANVSFETGILKTDPIPDWFIEKAPYFVKRSGLDSVYLEFLKYEDLDYYQSKQTDKDLMQAISGVKNSLKQLKAEVCVPCFYKERLLAFLIMGKKQKGSYTQEELDTFSLLAHDVAVAVRGGELREELEQSYIDAIHAIITALEERDAYSKGHSERVVEYSIQIAEELKDIFPFNRILNFIDKVRRAALLHDVGKIGVPDSILLKPGRLTDEEYSKLKEHPKTSLHIVQSIKNLSEDIRDGIEGHHERYDGKGYSKGSQGHHIPPIARIIAVADTFDAMTSDRPYRKMMAEKATVEEINKVSATQFDPKVVDAFNRAYEKGLLKK